MAMVDNLPRREGRRHELARNTTNRDGVPEADHLLAGIAGFSRGFL